MKPVKVVKSSHDSSVLEWPAMIVSTPLTPATAFESVRANSVALPPLLAKSMNGMFMVWNMSPVCIMRAARKTTNVSPLVCPGPKWYRSICSGPLNSDIRSVYVRLGRYFAFSPWNASQLVTGLHSARAMLARVFSCATTVIVSGSSLLLPEWSKWVCVLMTIVIGLSVTSRTRAMKSCP